MYLLTQENSSLEEPKKYADTGIENFSKTGLFSRQSHDHYYEAKLGICDLLTGLFRLRMIECGEENKLTEFDFNN